MSIPCLKNLFFRNTKFQTSKIRRFWKRLFELLLGFFKKNWLIIHVYLLWLSREDSLIIGQIINEDEKNAIHKEHKTKRKISKHPTCKKSIFIAKIVDEDSGQDFKEDIDTKEKIKKMFFWKLFY